MSGSENYLRTTKVWVLRYSNPHRENTFFSSLKDPDRLCGPQSFLLYWYHWYLSAGAWRWPLTFILYLHLAPWLQMLIKYKQNIFRHTQLMILWRFILTLFLSTTCFGCSYEPSSGWLLFLSKAKYNISKNSREISVMLFQSRKIYCTSNTVNGLILKGGGEWWSMESVHSPFRGFQSHGCHHK